MNSFTKIMALCGLLIAITGCFEEKITYTINPDGSGKADITYIVPLSALDSNMIQMGDGDSKPPLKEQLRKGVEKLITKTFGVETWKDVTYNFTKEGKVHFHGTAYFADFNKFKFEGINDKKNEEDKGGDIKLKITKNCMKLFRQKKVSDNTKSKDKKSPLENKIEYQNGRPMLQAYIGNMKISNTYIFPGNVSKCIGAKKIGNNRVSFTLDGKKLLNTVDTMVLNNNFSDIDFGQSQEMPINSIIQGMKLDADIKGPLKPLFNYKKEVAAAKLKWQGAKKKIFTKMIATGASVTKVDPVVATVKTDKSSKVVVAKYSKKVTKQEKDDFFLFQDGVELTVIQPLSGTATAVTKAVITKAEMMDGESILGDSDWDRKISFPKLAKNGQSVLLALKLKTPKKPDAGIKVIEGTIEYQNSSGEKIIDCGLVPLKKGATGKKLGVKIKEAGKGKAASHMLSEGESGFTLQIGLNNNSIIAVELYDKSGKKLDLKSGGTSWSGDISTYYFKTKKSLPKEIRIKVKAYKTAASKKMTFTLKNIDLFGNPLKK